MYPMKFLPVYKERIWGGNNIAKQFDRSTERKIGESWELCCHQHGMSIVKNGYLAGKTLREIMQTYKEQLMGSRFADQKDFPLMIKIIDANDRLSIQVHPENDFYCLSQGETGKTEAWYVLKAKDNAKIIYGLKTGITREAFVEAVKKNNIMETVRMVPVKTGDIIYVPAGMVHALFEGLVVYEIQQNCDTTYRLYDYERVGEDGVPRELHINRALDSINFGQEGNLNFNSASIECPYFKMQKLNVKRELKQYTNGNFIIFCVITGKGRLLYQESSERLNPGDTVLVPACLGEVIITGHVSLVKII